MGRPVLGQWEVKECRIWGHSVDTIIDKMKVNSRLSTPRIGYNKYSLTKSGLHLREGLCQGTSLAVCTPLYTLFTVHISPSFYFAYIHLLLFGYHLNLSCSQ